MWLVNSGKLVVWDIADFFQIHSVCFWLYWFAHFQTFLEVFWVLAKVFMVIGLISGGFGLWWCEVMSRASQRLLVSFVFGNFLPAILFQVCGFHTFEQNNDFLQGLYLSGRFSCAVIPKVPLLCQRDMYLILGLFPQPIHASTESGWTVLSSTCCDSCGVLCRFKAGLDDPGVSLLTQDVLWLCDSKPTPHSAGIENSDLISWPSPDRLPSGGEAGNLIFNSDSVSSSSAQPRLTLSINLYWIRKKSASQVSCMQTSSCLL